MNDDVFRTIEVSDPAIAADGLGFVTVKSRALRRRADVTLYVPSVAQGVADLPIVVLLHGVYGSHWAWALKGRAHLTAARLIARGALPPAVLVMPSDGLWGDGSGYVVHADHDVEHWIVDEVPVLARELVPGCSARSPLLVAGLSMGGFGALRLAGKYPDRIAAAAALSGFSTKRCSFCGTGEKSASAASLSSSQPYPVSARSGRMPNVTSCPSHAARSPARTASRNRASSGMT